MKKNKMNEGTYILFIIALMIITMIFLIWNNMRDEKPDIIIPEEMTTTISEETIISEEKTDDIIIESYDMTPEGPDNSLDRINIHEATFYNTFKTVGSSGRNLIDNYSIASSTLPLGLIVYIESDDGYISGYYRVDDDECSEKLMIYSEENQGQTIQCTVWIAGISY